MPTKAQPVRTQDEQRMALVVKAARLSVERVLDPQLGDLARRLTALERDLAKATEKLKAASDKFEEGKLDVVVKAVDKVRKEIGGETDDRLREFAKQAAAKSEKEVEGRLAQFAKELTATLTKSTDDAVEQLTQRFVDEQIERIGLELDARVEAHTKRFIDELSDELDAKLAAKVELVKESYEAALTKFVEVVKSLPSATVVNNLPELSVQNNMPELHVENRMPEMRPEFSVNVSPTPITVKASDVKNEIKVNPTPVTIENNVEAANVTVETPAMEKSFEYDAAGRPVKVIEKKAKKQ